LDAGSYIRHNFSDLLEEEMIQEVKKGSRVARIMSNDKEGPFTTVLFVNNGETITLIRKKAKTLAGALKQAAKMVDY
jgi:hypothetical protein